MRYSRMALYILACVIGSAAPARADGFITPYLGYNFGGDSSNCQTLTNCEDKHANFGVALGSGSGLFGFEEDIGYAKNFYGSVPGADNNVFTAMSNILAGVLSGPVQPYALVGIGLIRSHVSLNPTQISSTNNALGYDLGGGLNLYFSRGVGVRGDIRRFHTFQDVDVLRLNTIFTGEKLDYWRASVGIAFRFGR